MDDLIKSGTITETSRYYALNAPTQTAPDPQDIINDIKTRLQRIADPQDPLSDMRLSPQMARKNLERLDNLLNDLPEGMTLATVAYSKMDSADTRQTYGEFRSKVKPDFMKYLAKEYAGDLKKMGICAHGVSRMAKGFEPADEHGRVYEVSVDHIIERAGSGAMGTRQSVDPLRKAARGKGVAPSYEVNHFKNLVLLPNRVHFKCKNMLNELQDIGQAMNVGDFNWVVMLVPRRAQGDAPFLFAAPEHQKHKYGLRVKAMDMNARLTHAKFTMQALDAAFEGFGQSSQGYGHKLLDKCQTVADSQNASVGKILRRQQKALANDNLPTGTMPLKEIFRQELYGHAPKETVTKYHDVLRLANQTRDNLRRAFNTAVNTYKKTGKTHDLKDFSNFIQSKKMQDRLANLSRLPVACEGTTADVLGNFKIYRKQIKAALKAARANKKCASGAVQVQNAMPRRPVCGKCGCRP